jgi:phage-related tail protein
MVAVLPLLPIRAFTLEDGSLALELPDHAFIIPDTLRRQLKAERTGGSKVARDVAANALALLIQNEFFDVATLAAMDAPAALAVGAIIELIAIAIADTLVA